jgi:hypothetical protein
MGISPRGIPIAGAYADKVTAALNAAAQPLTETGPSHAPTFSERMGRERTENQSRTDAYEVSRPVGTAIAKFALGSAPFLAAAPSAVAARALGMSGTLPQMIRAGMTSGAAIGGANAAARGEDVGRGRPKVPLPG